MKDCKKNLTNIVACIGASKGIGHAICKKFTREGFTPVFISRGNPEKIIDTQINIKIDIDNNESISACLNSFSKLIDNKSPMQLSCHFLSGGSLGIQKGEDGLKLNEYSRILMHNMLFPYWFISSLRDRMETNNTLIEYHLYSSAAAYNNKSHFIYSVSKAGIEKLHKEVLNNLRHREYIFCYRLGIINVKHKYLHKLSRTEPTKYMEIIKNEVPTNYTATPQELAEFIYKCSQNRSLCNGMKCDLSGGNTWTMN